MRNQVMLIDSYQLSMLNSLTLLSIYRISNHYQRRCEVFVHSGFTTQRDELETDAGRSALHMARTKSQTHWHTPSIINKYVTHVMHKHTHTVDCPQFPLQSDIKAFPAWAFHLVKWMSLRHTFLPSPFICKQPFVPITDYPSYLEAISLAD